MHTGDEAIAAIARRQHGIATGRLVRLHRGVFQVGPVAAERGPEMAAVLATGGILSHLTAADLWGIRPHHGAIHITVTGPVRRPRPGLRIHRSHSLNAAVHQGLPLTTPTRTLHDLGACLPQHELDRAVEQAQILHLATRDEIEVDLLWRRERLIVEVDGFAYHSTRQAFERDRARDAALQAAGYRVVRLTWRQIAYEPLAVVVQLARLLAASASPAPIA